VSRQTERGPVAGSHEPEPRAPFLPQSEGTLIAIDDVIHMAIVSRKRTVPVRERGRSEKSPRSVDEPWI
jgi:hypothetical protein